MEAKAGIYKDISDAARGVTSEVAGVSRQVEGVGKEVLNNRFATERGLCDLGYKTNSDIRDSRDQMGAGFNRVVDAQRDQNIINSVVQALGNKTA